MTIDTCRRKIDEINRQLVELLNDRASWALQIGELKKQAGRQVYDADREHQIMDQIRAMNNGPLSNEALLRIFQAIFEENRSLQFNSGKTQQGR